MDNITIEEFITLSPTQQLSMLHIFGNIISDMLFKEYNYLAILWQIFDFYTEIEIRNNVITDIAVFDVECDLLDDYLDTIDININF